MGGKMKKAKEIKKELLLKIMDLPDLELVDLADAHFNYQNRSVKHMAESYVFLIDHFQEDHFTTNRDNFWKDPFLMAVISVKAEKLVKEIKKS
jgi:hypothetical protein